MLKISAKGGTIYIARTLPPIDDSDKSCSKNLTKPMPVLSSTGIPLTCSVLAFSHSVFLYLANSL